MFNTYQSFNLYKVVTYQFDVTFNFSGEPGYAMHESSIHGVSIPHGVSTLPTACRVVYNNTSAH